MNDYICDTNSIPTKDMAENKNSPDRFYISESQKIFGEIGETKVCYLNILTLNKEVFDLAREIVKKYINDPEKNVLSLAKNEGNCDPFIIAHAINEKEKEKGKMKFSNQERSWIIVSKESAIKKICLDYEIECISNYENKNQTSIE